VFIVVGELQLIRGIPSVSRKLSWAESPRFLVNVFRGFFSVSPANTGIDTSNGSMKFGFGSPRSLES